jgi:hypothetical protein
MRFESKKDLDRVVRAIDTFVNSFGGSYEKLGDNDIDFKVYDKNKNLISYVEIKGRLRSIENAFPLPVAARKLVKLADKRLNPVIIWACDEGIIYAKLKDLEGKIRFGGRAVRAGSSNDLEVMAYFDYSQKSFKIVNY